MGVGKSRKTLCEPFPIQIVDFEVAEYLHESRLLNKKKNCFYCFSALSVFITNLPYNMITLISFSLITRYCSLTFLWALVLKSVRVTANFKFHFLHVEFQI